jgi:hypothetical protein
MRIDISYALKDVKMRTNIALRNQSALSVESYYRDSRDRSNQTMQSQPKILEILAGCRDNKRKVN